MSYKYMLIPETKTIVSIITWRKEEMFWANTIKIAS